jgi:hypothetical protein
MDIIVNRTKIMQKVKVEYALILIGLGTGTYMFVYICTHTQFFFRNNSLRNTYSANFYDIKETR